MRRRIVLTSAVGLLAGLGGRVAVPEPTTGDAEARPASDRNRTTPNAPTRERSGAACDGAVNHIVERTFVPNSRDAYGYFATAQNTTTRNTTDRNGSNKGPIAVEFVPSKNRVLVYGTTFATQCNGGLKLRSATYDADSDTLSLTIGSDTTPPGSAAPTDSAGPTGSGAPIGSETRSEPMCIPNQGEVAYEATVTFSSRLPTTVVVSTPTARRRFTR